MVRCWRSTIPLSLEFYTEILMCQIPYLLANQSSAATKAVLLSVTISSTAPHLHKISSKMKLPSVCPVSVLRARHSGYAVREQRAWTT